MIHPEAFTLLNLSNATLKAENTIYDGTLALECVTIPVSQSSLSAQAPARDVYLVLRIKSYETPLDPSRAIRCFIQNGFRNYSFLGASGEDIVVTLHEPSLAHEPQIKEDLDTFDSVLEQYAGFEGPNPFGSLAGSEKLQDLRGHVLLINEDNGDVVGEVDNQIVFQEDPALHEKGREKEPVIIEIPEEGGARAAFVHAVPPSEQGIFTKGASSVRCVHIILPRIVRQLNPSKLRDIGYYDSSSDSYDICLFIPHQTLRVICLFFRFYIPF